MSIPIKDLLTAVALPPDLRHERWLIVGDEPNDFVAALAPSGAHLTFAHWDELASFSGARFAVVVCQRLFAGVRHPLLALENVCALTSSYALLHAPMNTLNDERAWLCWDESVDGWQANRTALARLARSAGFACVVSLSESDAAVWLQAFRQWPAPIEPLTPSLTIRRVFNPVTGLTVFPRRGRRAFLALVVAGLPATAQRWEVKVSVGGFGVQPIYVGRCQLADHDDCVQVNVPLPPGLPVGLMELELWHQCGRAVTYGIEISEGSVG